MVIVSRCIFFFCRASTDPQSLRGMTVAQPETQGWIFLVICLAVVGTVFNPKQVDEKEEGCAWRCRALKCQNPYPSITEWMTIRKYWCFTNLFGKWGWCSGHQSRIRSRPDSRVSSGYSGFLPRHKSTHVSMLNDLGRPLVYKSWTHDSFLLTLNKAFFRMSNDHSFHGTVRVKYKIMTVMTNSHLARAMSRVLWKKNNNNNNNN